MKKIIYPCLLILLGCNNAPKQKGLVYFNDCEAIKGWTSVNLSKKIVHSGIYSNKIDSSHAFGLTFRLPFKEISDEKVVKVKVSLWVYMEPQADGNLVVEVRKPNTSAVLWVGKRLSELVKKRGEWQKIEASFTLENDSVNKPDNVIGIYPWNLTKKDIYIDDTRIEFVVGY